MVFYFTGTGNSLWVAKMLSRAFDEPMASMAELLKEEREDYLYPLREEERVFFVFPVHSWGPAVLVHRFIEKLCLSGYQNQPVYSVCTCGDESGYTTRRIHKWLSRIGVRLTAGFSVKMPNNYILLPGFSVDPKELEQKKLQEAVDRVASIIGAIRNNETKGLDEIGFLPALKSYLVYPLFAHVAIGSNSFRVTDDCISCGLCVRICPTGTITLSTEGKPVWSNTCVQCVACIHRCPVRAIEYGNETVKKGRYHHPEL